MTPRRVAHLALDCWSWLAFLFAGGWVAAGALGRGGDPERHPGCRDRAAAAAAPHGRSPGAGRSPAWRSTPRAAEEGDVEAASSGLAIGLMGVGTAVVAPLVLALMERVGLLSALRRNP